MENDIVWVQVRVGSRTNASDILNIEERLRVVPGMNRWVVLTEIDNPNFPEVSGKGLPDAVTKYIGYKTARVKDTLQEAHAGGRQHKPSYTINEVKDTEE